MKTVKEVSRLTGISVRTLHHYDAIGLLKPTEVTAASYRLYDDSALCRLQSILLFRELMFPLKEIKAILDRPDLDRSELLRQQIDLLELQYKHLGELIRFAREIQMKGNDIMDFKAFDVSDIEEYKAEVKAKWGQTKEYQEYKQKAGKRGGFDSAGTAQRMMELFSEIGALRQLPPEDEAVQEKIAALQSFITENYYTCSDEVLMGLGQMYVGDERFRKNIDRVAGDGTAEFVSRAIGIYCSENRQV